MFSIRLIYLIFSVFIFDHIQLKPLCRSNNLINQDLVGFWLRYEN